jgi:DNA-binding CsgD family transcriptional regulator
MKTRSLKNRDSWLSYMDGLKGKTSQEEQHRLTGFDDFFNANRFVNSFLRHSIPFFYLLDYKTGLYINMSENFAGYDSEAFLKNGINHTLEIYHTNHLRVFDKEIFPDRLAILKEIRPEEYKNHVFSYNMRIKNRNGEYENFLQRSCFLPDTSGNPVCSMGILININHYNSDNPIIQTVDKIGGSVLNQNQTIYKKAYYLNEEDKLFSKREKEVLLWMADGLSSKMIAQKLFVSEHTVINHRRNMQNKVNAPNAIALVNFAIRNGIV